MFSETLHARAPAKINLGLFLGPTRADGRHELVTVMQSISLADELTLRPAGGPGEEAGDRDRVLAPGVPGPPDANLAARALAAFRAATGWSAPALELRIDKRVPVAAGLGGGSGDAAAALRLAAAASGRGEQALLLKLAAALGADVPAQVRPGRWLAGGAGERLQALPQPGSGADCGPQPARESRRGPQPARESKGGPQPAFGVLVLPAAGVLSTAAVYAHADRMALGRDGTELRECHDALARALVDGAPLPPTDLLVNDLQRPAVALCPEIDSALAQARSAGADVALVSGSGPTVLGLFAGVDGMRRAGAAAETLAHERAAAGAPAPQVAEPVDASYGEPARAGRGEPGPAN